MVREREVSGYQYPAFSTRRRETGLFSRSLGLVITLFPWRRVEQNALLVLVIPLADPPLKDIRPYKYSLKRCLRVFKGL